MIKEIEEKYSKFMSKTITATELKELDRLVKKLRESILEVIDNMDVNWCSKKTGIKAQNFYSFRDGYKWSIDRMIKVYKMLIK